MVNWVLELRKNMLNDDTSVEGGLHFRTQTHSSLKSVSVGLSVKKRPKWCSYSNSHPKNRVSLSLSLRIFSSFTLKPTLTLAFRADNRSRTYTPRGARSLVWCVCQFRHIRRGCKSTIFRQIFVSLLNYLIATSTRSSGAGWMVRMISAISRWTEAVIGGSPSGRFFSGHCGGGLQRIRMLTHHRNLNTR